MQRQRQLASRHSAACQRRRARQWRRKSRLRTSQASPRGSHWQHWPWQRTRLWSLVGLACGCLETPQGMHPVNPPQVAAPALSQLTRLQSSVVLPSATPLLMVSSAMALSEATDLPEC